MLTDTPLLLSLSLSLSLSHTHTHTHTHSLTLRLFCVQNTCANPKADEMASMVNANPVMKGEVVERVGQWFINRRTKYIHHHRQFHGCHTGC